MVAKEVNELNYQLLEVCDSSSSSKVELTPKKTLSLFFQSTRRILESRDWSEQPNKFSPPLYPLNELDEWGSLSLR